MPSGAPFGSEADDEMNMREDGDDQDTNEEGDLAEQAEGLAGADEARDLVEDPTPESTTPQKQESAIDAETVDGVDEVSGNELGEDDDYEVEPEEDDDEEDEPEDELDEESEEEQAEETEPEEAEEDDEIVPAAVRDFEEEDDTPAQDVAVAEPEEEAAPKQWYVLKVQSNREDSIRDAIVRRIKIAGLEDRLGEIVVPTEKITEIKGGKKRVMERKFFPGYIMVNVELDHDVWFAIRETPGVGDFIGVNNKPIPMTPEDVGRMLGRQADEAVEAQPKLKINFDKGDRVKIKEGTFENFEGDVEEVIEAKGVVRVMIQIFGRPTPVELEYWQVESV